MLSMANILLSPGMKLIFLHQLKNLFMIELIQTGSKSLWNPTWLFILHSMKNKAKNWHDQTPVFECFNSWIHYQIAACIFRHLPDKLSVPFNWPRNEITLLLYENDCPIPLLLHQTYWTVDCKITYCQHLLKCHWSGNDYNKVSFLPEKHMQVYQPIEITVLCLSNVFLWIVIKYLIEKLHEFYWNKVNKDYYYFNHVMGTI